MENEKRATVAGMKDRALHELKVFCISAFYLWVFLGSFMVYRRLILAEAGVTYLHYGFALIEALIIAKVILVGRMFGFSRRFDTAPLIVPVLYKSVLFGVFVLLFGIAEHLIEGWAHKQGLFGGLHDIGELGADELGARVLMLIVSFVPFFAFWEMGRVLGTTRLAAIFFSKTESRTAIGHRDTGV